MTHPSDADTTLSAIHVVLVGPRSPGNVGAAARSMANAGLGRLVLVDPPTFDPDIARWMAPGAHARIDDILFVQSVAEAIDELGVDRVIATSARARRLATPTWTPPELASAILRTPRPTAIVFGPEDFGLDNEAVSRCDAVLRIPTAAHSSLNLAQAVGITTHALRMAAADEAPVETSPLASASLRAHLTDDLLDVLSSTTYFAGRSATHTRARITAALHGLRLTHDDAATARGMLKSLKHRIRSTPETYRLPDDDNDLP